MASIQNVVRRIVSKVIQEQRGGYGTKVREVISKLNEYSSKTFDKRDLKRLATNVAEEMNLKYLGAGIHRSVYAIDDDHVLKIGDSMANDVESDPKAQAILGPFAPRVYYRGPYAIWVIVERVRMCKNVYHWWEDAGVSSINVNGIDAYDYSTAISAPSSLKNYIKDKDRLEHFILHVTDSDIGRRLLRIENETNISVTDLHAGNLGYGSDGRPVIIDLGMNKSDYDVKESKSIREQRGGYGTKVREIIAKLNEIPKEIGENEIKRRAVNVAESMDLQYLGSGVHRVVYAIDDDHVLKIGTSRSNDVESDPKVQAILGPFATKVYYRGPYAVWVIAERVTTCSDIFKWWNDAGVPDFDLTGTGLGSFEYPFAISAPQIIQKSVGDEKVAEEFIMNIVNSDIGRRLLRINSDTRALVMDLKAENVGYGSDGRPVILDLGHTKSFHAVKESRITESIGSNADLVIRKLRNVEKMVKGGDEDIQMGLERAAKEMSRQGHLKHIATATRSVWRIVGEDLVLKIMGGEDDLYDSGDDDVNLHQNKFEASPQLQQIMGPYLPRTIAKGRHHRWIISELAQPIQQSELDDWAAAASLPEEFVFKGKIWLDVFYDAMQKHYADDSFDFDEELAVYNIYLNQSDIVPMQQNDLFMRLVRAHNEVGVSLGDLKWRNLGWSLDDGRPVILDLGA